MWVMVISSNFAFIQIRSNVSLIKQLSDCNCTVIQINYKTVNTISQSISINQSNNQTLVLCWCTSGWPASVAGTGGDDGELPQVSISGDSSWNHWLQDQDLPAGYRQAHPWASCHHQSWRRRLTAGKLTLHIRVFLLLLLQSFSAVQIQ